VKPQKKPQQEQEGPGRKVSMGDVYKARLPELGGQAEGFLREGAKDLHNALVPAFPDSQRGVDEPGTPLSPPQAAVDRSLGGRSTLDELRGYAKGQEAEALDRMQGRQQEPDRQQGPDGPEM
jgi:hypothetical protein